MYIIFYFLYRYRKKTLRMSFFKTKMDPGEFTTIRFVDFIYKSMYIYTVKYYYNWNMNRKYRVRTYSILIFFY